MKEFKCEYVIFATVIGLIICGVVFGLHFENKMLNPPLEKNFYKWEYSSFCPLTTTTDELLQIERTLVSNGYTRVVIRPKYNETWTTVERVGTEIFATRRLPAFSEGKENNE